MLRNKTTMDCLLCCGEGVVAGECIEDALEIIKKHFCFYQNFAQDKDKQLRLSQERNEKLSKAVCLLHRGAQHKNSQALSNSQPAEPEPKRRKTQLQVYDLTQEEIAGALTAPARVFQNSTDLLNSPQAVISSTDTDLSIYDLTQDDETPAAKIASQSPKVLVLDVEEREATYSSNELHNSANVGQRTDLPNTIQGAPDLPEFIQSSCFPEARSNEKDCKNDDLTKKRDCRLDSIGCSSDSTFCDEEIVVNRILKGPSNGNQNEITDKINEASVQLNVNNAVQSFPEKDFDPNETFIDLENCALEDNLTMETEFNAPAEKTKVSQSINSSCAARQLLNTTEGAPDLAEFIQSSCFPEAGSNEKGYKNDDLTKKRDSRLDSIGSSSDSTICDDKIVSRILKAPSNGKFNEIADRTYESAVQLNENKAVECVPEKDFDPDETFIDLESCAFEVNEIRAPAGETNSRPLLNSSCVALLTPEDVVFLEDSFVDTDVKSMDWLDEIENNRLNSTLIRANEPSTTFADKENIQRTPSEQPSTSRNANLPMKQEKETQPTLTQEKTSLLNSGEESDDYAVNPILVKEEVMSEHVSARKSSLKERFNIDCRECENYIDFLAGQLTDEQIEQHLRKCTRHKERDILAHQTPEGFWNPLLQSLPKDDPRNEILIDKRFLGTKRDN